MEGGGTRTDVKPYENPMFVRRTNIKTPNLEAANHCRSMQLSIQFKAINQLQIPVGRLRSRYIKFFTSFFFSLTREPEIYISHYEETEKAQGR